jgi:uncharacterized OsmC-like protein
MSAHAAETAFGAVHNLTAGASAGNGPAWWITILVAAIAACASIAAAVVAARSAQSTKRIEVESQRARELESRISERKFDTYRPVIEMFGDLTSGTRSSIVLANQEENVEKLQDFATWINIYASDDAVVAYHNFIQAAYNGSPVMIAVRLYAEFTLAARRDIGFPDTKVAAIQIMGIRISDLYSEESYRQALTIPFDELCRREGWTPPWLSEAVSAPSASSLNPSSSS